MSKRMVKAMEQSVADKMRDKGRKEMGSESAEYRFPKIPAGLRKKMKAGKK